MVLAASKARLKRALVMLVLVNVGAIFLPSCKRLKDLSAASSAPKKLFLESCEDARNLPEGITWDDVRWVDCDRPTPTSRAEAFTLGEPIYAPLPGPHVQDSRWYSPGHCEHGGGAISEHNVWYKAEDLNVAIDCSRRRCEANDRLGCRDLGTLHWEVDLYPAVTKNETVARSGFEAGCRLGDGASCLSLAYIHKKRGEAAGALARLTDACNSDPPMTHACEEVGQVLLGQDKPQEAKPFYMRGCRGTTHRPTVFDAHRDGCGPLAELARQRGDDLSWREYLRLDCAYGSAPLSCQSLGLMLLREGEKRRATPYLRKACGVLDDSKRVFHRACEALAEADK